MIGRFLFLTSFACCVSGISAQNLPAFRWIKQIDGSGADSVVGMGTDASGNVYVAGNTASSDFPVKSAIQSRSASAGLYRIDGNGPGFTPLSLPSAQAVAVDPQNSNVIYASSNGALLRSSDGGITWSNLPLNASKVAAIAIDPSNHATLYAGSYALGAFKSTDSGATWTAINSGLQPSPNFNGQIAIYHFWIDPNNPNVVFANGASGPTSGGFRSSDGGSTWKADPMLSNLSSIWFDLATPSLVYATTFGAALKSTDDGQTWTSLRGIPAGPNTYATLLSITSDPNRAGRLILNTYLAIYESTDDGATFTQRLTLQLAAVTPDWANGALYTEFNKIIRISSDLKTVTTVGPPALPSANQILVANGQVYAAMSPSNDVFVTKLDASGNIVWSTYFGGAADDNAKAMTVDSAGNVFVTGVTGSADFPTTAGAYARSIPVAGANASFVFKISSTGSLAYSTYFADSESTPQAIAVDAAGEAIITGSSQGDLPTTPGAYQGKFLGTTFCFLARPDSAPHPNLCIFAVDGFATKFDAQGATLAFSTYIGQSDQISFGGSVVAAASDGSVFIGNTSNLYHLNAAGSSLLSSGGVSGTVGAIATSANGNLYVTGETGVASQFPTTPGAFLPAPLPIPNLPGQGVAQAYGFVTEFAPDLKQIVASTLLGRGNGLQPKSVAIDSSGNVLVGGGAGSFGLQTKAPLANAFWPQTGFVSLLKSDLSSLLFSTYLGDAEIFTVQSVAPSPDGDFVIAGNTGQPNNANSGPVKIFLNKLTIGGNLPVRIDSVLNAASMVNAPLSPGETVVVRGSGFGSDAQISIGGSNVKPIAIDSQNLIAVVPTNLSPGAALVQVVSGGVSSNYVAVPIATTGPGLFSADGSGYGQGYILNPDGTRNSPTNPAKIGDQITIFATGVGPVSFDGIYAVAQFTPAVYVDGFYCNGVAAVSGSMPGFPGVVYQLTIIVPDPAKANPDLKDPFFPPQVPIVLKANGVASQSGLAISIGQ